MKFIKLSALVLIFGSLVLSAKSDETHVAENTWWFVTSRDPHLMAELAPQVRAYHDYGRILVVQIKKQWSKLPRPLRENLVRVPISEIRTYTPKPIRLPSNPRIFAMAGNLSPLRMKTDVSNLVGFKNRGAGNKDNQMAAEWVRDTLAGLGLTVRLDCFKQGICNIFGEQKGNVAPEEMVYVVAHMDSVGHSFAGADDNASGTAALIEMARALSAQKTKRTIRYFVTNAEENGLVGSRAHVRGLTPAQISQIKFVINMDMVAYNANGLVDIETNKEFTAQAEWMSALVRTYTKLTPNITMPAWGSDHVPFLEKKIPTILTIEHWKTKTPCYHLACDVESSLNYDYMKEIVKLNLAALAEVAVLN